MNTIHNFISRLAKYLLSFSLIKQWFTKHPKIYMQLNSRLTLQSFNGLPLSILIAFFLYTVYLLLGIIHDYQTHDSIILLDTRIANLFYFWRSDIALRFFYFFTLFAESSTIIFLALIMSLLFWLNKQKIFISSLWFLLIVGEGLTFVGKHIFQRMRPEEILRAITEDSFSFPSGHATSVVLFYGFLTYIVIRKLQSWKSKIFVITAFILIVVLVDISRLYLGVHYFSDVMAGNLVGFSTIILAVALTEWFINSKPQVKPAKFKLSELFIIVTLAIVTVLINYKVAQLPINNIKAHSSKQINLSEIPTLFDENKLPRFTETITGDAQEPLNILLVSQENCLVNYFKKANWNLAENLSLISTEKLVKTVIFNESYLTAPMTPSFYNSQPHDYGFEKETDQKTVRSRNHARFWNTGYETPQGILFAGTVSLDTGIKWGITHTISPDIDTERNLLAADLKNAGIVNDLKVLQFIPPSTGKNFAGDQFFTNGQAILLEFSFCAE